MRELKHRGPTPLILNKSIERIEVVCVEVVTGHKQQEITIV